MTPSVAVRIPFDDRAVWREPPVWQRKLNELAVLKALAPERMAESNELD